MNRSVPIVFLILLGLTASVAAGIRDQVDAIILQSGAEVGLAFSTLDGERQLFIRDEESFHAASTMKIPVMIELFRQRELGKLSLEDPLPVVNHFTSVFDGSSYRLDPSDDSDVEVYEAVGGTLTLRQLCDAMITVSSNFAANLLMQRLGVENIRQAVAELGGSGMEVRRGVEDIPAYRNGLNNTTSARGLFHLLKALAEGRAVSEGASQEMLEILKRQRFNDGLPSGLPDGVEIAHKTGQITGIHHDAGIVLASRPFVLVLLVRGVDDPERSARLMGDLTRVLYRWSNAGR